MQTLENRIQLAVWESQEKKKKKEKLFTFSFATNLKKGKSGMKHEVLIVFFNY